MKGKHCRTWLKMQGGRCLQETVLPSWTPYSTSCCSRPPTWPWRCPPPRCPGSWRSPPCRPWPPSPAPFPPTPSPLPGWLRDQRDVAASLHNPCFFSFFLNRDSTCFIIVDITTITRGATEVKGVTGGSGRLNWGEERVHCNALEWMSPESQPQSESRSWQLVETAQTSWWRGRWGGCTLSSWWCCHRKPPGLGLFSLSSGCDTWTSWSSWSWKGAGPPPTGTIRRWNHRADFLEENRAWYKTTNIW